jgi:hypothetical protein
MTKGSGLNSSKHYPNSISSQFPPESGFDLLLSFPSRIFETGLMV